MKIELVDEQNYEILTEWWKGYSWPVVPFAMLPKIGFIVNDTVAGFIYSTDSKICMVEWIVGNPKSVKEERKKALEELLTLLCSTAKEMGYTHCFTYTKNSGLINTLMQSGFQKTDEQMVHFMRSL